MTRKERASVRWTGVWTPGSSLDPAAVREPCRSDERRLGNLNSQNEDHMAESCPERVGGPGLNLAERRKQEEADAAMTQHQPAVPGVHSGEMSEH